VTVDEQNNFKRLRPKTKVILDSVFRHLNSKRKTLFCEGGFINQPKLFWSLIDLADRTESKIQEKERQQAEKNKNGK